MTREGGGSLGWLACVGSGGSGGGGGSRASGGACRSVGRSVGRGVRGSGVGVVAVAGRSDRFCSWRAKKRLRYIEGEFEV